MIVSNTTQEALTELIKQCFTENRVFDRLVSVLGVKFAYNNTAKLLHQGVAHYFPMLSDKIGESCLERYNISVLYGETLSAYEDYDSVADIINTVENRTIDFQSMMIGVCKIAFENDDLQVFADLQELLKDYNRIVEQAILLKDKFNAYGDNPVFDAHIKEHFWILGE